MYWHLSHLQQFLFNHVCKRKGGLIMKKLILLFIVFLLVFSSVACSSADPISQSAPEESKAAKEDKHSASSNQSQTSVVSEGKAAGNSADMASTAAESPMMNPPNGAEYHEMHFKHYGTNPFVSTEDDKQSTFAVDVDTGSYTVMRNYINRGSLPPEEAVRVEEFINYFKMDYRVPEDETFAIHIDGGNSAFGEGYQLLRVGVKGKEVEVEDRKDARLMFVIDVSGSMDRENRLELVKKSLRLLVDQLGDRDKVGIVVYGSQGEKILDPTSIDEKDKILEAIDRLRPGGSTNAEEGLQIGYEMASEYFKDGAVNRVILCSDGVANVGKTGADGILKTIKKHAQEGITLSTFGFGMGNYNDVLMEQLADKGDGNYAYVDTFSEARRIFTEELTGTLQTIAKDVKIQVEFDPEKVDRYRLIGYENRDIKDKDFRNDNVDAGEIGSGHSVTALYEIKLKGDHRRNLGEVRLRYKDVESEEVEELRAPIQVGDELPKDLEFLASVAEFSEILRGSFWAKESSLRNVLELAEESAEDEQQMEFVRLIKDSIAIKGK
jgi:Ca-activated chloride channel family protein